MKKYTRVSFIFLVILSINIKLILAQDPLFSQPYANPVYLNPAYAGTSNSQRFGFDYQNLSPADFITFNASYDRNFIDSNNGIAILANMENSGFTQGLTTSNNALTTTNISLIYAHQFHIGSFILSTGAQLTYLNISLDESKLEYNNYPNFVGWPDVITANTLLRNSITVPDYSGGILGYGKNYFLGFSADHLSQPDESFYQGARPLSTRYTVSAGAMAPVGSIIFTPIVLYEQQGNIEQTMMEFYVSTKHITAGVGYGSFNTIVVMVGYQSKSLRVGFSFSPNSITPEGDYMITGNTGEASLALLLNYSKAKRKKVTGLNCPAF